MKKLVFIIASILLWASCSNQDEPVNQAPEATQAQSESRYISPSEAVKRASEAYKNMFGKGSRSTLSGRAYLYNASTGSRSFGTDSVLYVVNFDEGGFAVVPAYRYDDTEAYAIGEHSTFDASQNPAAEKYMEGLTGYASFIQDSIKNTINKPDPEIHYLLPWRDGIPAGWHQDSSDPQYWFHDIREDSLYDRVMVTQWSQRWPYNKYCPRVLSLDGTYDYMPTGCVAVAIGQLCGYYRTPLKSIDGYALDWDGMLQEEGANYLPGEYEDQVARLLRQIGIRTKSNYTLTITTSPMSDYYPAIKELGFSGATVSSNFDSCSDYVIKKGPCMVEAKDLVSGDYHAWVIDGIRVRKNNTYRAHYANISVERPYSIDENTYIHCNWGWAGQGDGYFLFNVKTFAHRDISYSGEDISKDEYKTITVRDFAPTPSTYKYIINLK